MEFMNRSNQPGQPQNVPSQTAPGGNMGGKRGKSYNNAKIAHVGSMLLLFSVAILVLAVVSSLVFGGGKSTRVSEARYVETDKMQAVFLNGGQVYFGKIKDLNSQYLRLADIFYLRVNQVVQPNQEGNQAQQNDISLVKLGCELHRPSNEMLINRDQVVFWENLKNEDGENTVPGAVKKYLAQFPDGQECEQPAQNSGNDQNINQDANNGNNNR